MKPVTSIVQGIDENLLSNLIEDIKFIIDKGINENQRIIFLCGADKSDKKSLRYKFSLVLENHSMYELTYPEDLFEDLLEGQGENSLLSLEEQLADAVDLIALIPESPGSFAELGAFSTQETLARKTVVFRNAKFKTHKSFINHGPLRLIKRYKGSVVDIPSDFDPAIKAHRDLVINSVKKRIGQRRKRKETVNILAYPSQILLLIYLFDGLNYWNIEDLMTKVHTVKASHSEKVAYKAALHSLLRKNHIQQLDSNYSITELGYQYINEKYYQISKITALRFKIMNKQMKAL
ncbi:retron St85 family effector protein [Vibrio cholerae]|uniref:retron St85 family effector protein n=1 Tax=Vibrio cholerae TaxID=666 RepID=UPI0000ED69FA|nr:retron St85 family effector protein [Vibrio cholerae]EGQ7705095.1 UDP-3-O-(3-hydroxymyristoyl)glucosamine N-acyltransferase [Vibrio cholerae]EGR0264810.1 UDP-3-O-(3-hydroxymyristoyl)glucosamine N-acyltransferase [Vibrio cholerae]EGR0366776.1 UDP-3-O-(3-hydroxymyristoyl)glucosamine N-acyltransferase [Vibrio cholerae]EGR0939395.1 UDP-3-O-(3-hydroxymyristoyl)glucosamine N-acyltransferase [Vibrio cholerae]EGR4142713.1 UDP-3-O-(3-hydroxymyristoyl)glucosamine N-acyltransferase [Vibrio cholerae]